MVREQHFFLVRELRDPLDLHESRFAVCSFICWFVVCCACALVCALHVLCMCAQGLGVRARVRSMPGGGGAVCGCGMNIGGAGVGVEWGRRRRAEQMAMRELDGGMERVMVPDGRAVVLVLRGIYVWHVCDV